MSVKIRAAALWLGAAARLWQIARCASFGVVLAAGPAAAAIDAPPPGADLVLELGAGNRRITATGTLPEGLSRWKLAELLPRLQFDRLGGGGEGDPARWTAALEALNVVLPRIEMARIRMRPGRVEVRGRLREGFSLRETRPALRAALGEGWRLDFRMIEAPPPAAVAFSHDARGTRLSGILPAGLSVRQALLATDGATAAGLTSGGAGAPATWSRALAALGLLLRTYNRAEGTLSAAEGLRLDGRLAPGHAPEGLSDWAWRAMPEGWRVEIAGRTAPAVEGAERFDPETRLTERLTGGHWLPRYRFLPSKARCNAEAAHIQAGAKLRFAPYAETLDARAGAVLDRLAGLARHCLTGTELLLEIGGHTDSSGEAERNRELSRARARSVRRALAARGVPDRAMRARGYGDARPLASNETDTGRARNRRITFEWRWPAATDGIEQALEQ